MILGKFSRGCMRGSGNWDNGVGFFNERDFLFRSFLFYSNMVVLFAV